MTQPSPSLTMTGLLARRSYTISRGTALSGLGLLAVLAGLNGLSGWYLLSKDDLAARLIARETARQYAYEDRIASLRADIDRLASRALLNQDGVEARVDELATRQADLESRQAMVAALTDAMQTGGLIPAQKPVPRGRTIEPQVPLRASSVTSFAPIHPTKPTPAPEPAADGKLSWHSGAAPKAPAERVGAVIGDLDRAIASAELAQLSALRRLDETLVSTQRSLRTALTETGLDIDRLANAGSSGGVGGPLVPVKVDASSGAFETTLNAIQPRVAAVTRLRGLVEKLPLRRPMPEDTETSSNFGYRMDPFTRGPAMHTGIDFRAEQGSPVRATAPGKVITAEYAGGYGNMVEIEHVGGLTTRYAHMSAIGVSVGQSVQAGAVVGRVGSTGRSTGPHLHYETRIDDEALDPMRFLRAGNRLASQL